MRTYSCAASGRSPAFAAARARPRRASRLPGILAEHAPPLVHRLVVLLGLPEALGQPEPERAARPVEGHRLSILLERRAPLPERVEDDPPGEVGLRVPGDRRQHRIPLGERLLPQLAVREVLSQGAMVPRGSGRGLEGPGDEGLRREGAGPRTAGPRAGPAGTSALSTASRYAVSAPASPSAARASARTRCSSGLSGSWARAASMAPSASRGRFCRSSSRASIQPQRRLAGRGHLDGAPVGLGRFREKPPLLQQRAELGPVERRSRAPSPPTALR